MTLESYISGRSKLNQHMVKLSGHRITFFVHYWVSEHRHYDNPIHKHSFYEAHYIHSGKGIYIENGHEYELQANTIFLTRPKQWHQILSADGMCASWVGFEILEEECGDDYIAMLKRLQSGDKVCLAIEPDSPARLLWTALLKNLEQGESLSDAFNESLGHAVLSSLCKLFKQNEQEVSQPLARTHNEIIYSAQMYIRDNLSTSLHLDDLCKHLHLSKRHLSRLFSEEMGQTFINYVRQERINQAVSYLKTSNASIKYITKETGFENIHYFTRVFTEKTGVTPARFRKLWKDGSNNPGLP